MKRKIGINERMGRKRDEELAEIMAAIEAAHGVQTMDWSWEKGGAYINVPVEIKLKRKARKPKAKKIK